MKKTLSIITAAIVGAVITTTSASAVQYTYQGEVGGLTIGLHTVNPQYPNASFGVGTLNMTTTDSGWTSSLYTYCTDIGSTLASTHAYQAYQIPPAQLGVNPTWQAGGIEKAAALYAINHSTSMTDVQRAGLQLAIWEVENNTKTSYTAADFFNTANTGFYITSANSGNIALAASYAAQILNNVLGLSSSQIAAYDQQVLWLAPVETVNGQTKIQGSQGLFYSVPDVASSLFLLAIAIAAVAVLKKTFAAEQLTHCKA